MYTYVTVILKILQETFILDCLNELTLWALIQYKDAILPV